MEALTQIVGDLNSIVWGVPILILILGAGFTLHLALDFCPSLKFHSALTCFGRAVPRATIRGSAPSTPS